MQADYPPWLISGGDVLVLTEARATVNSLIWLTYFSHSRLSTPVYENLSRHLSECDVLRRESSHILVAISLRIA